MKISDKELSTDFQAIMHIITAPPAQDDSEAEWERIELLDSAWVGFQNKYPREFLNDLEDALMGIYDVFSEKLIDGDYGDE